MEKLFVAIFIWNIMVFLFYGSDKLYAKKGKRRVRESALLWSAFLLGGCGAMFGMVVFNHKTSKAKFRFLVPIFVIINFVIYVSAKNFLIK